MRFGSDRRVYLARVLDGQGVVYENLAIERDLEMP